MMTDYELIEALADSYELPSDYVVDDWPEEGSIDDKVREIMAKLTAPKEDDTMSMMGLRRLNAL